MRKKLFFGQYLIGVGLIAERDVLQALEYQNRETPTFQQVALELAYLDMRQLFKILTLQADSELSFSEVALRNGFMAEHQVERVNQFIAKRRPPLGVCLVTLGKLSAEDLERELARFHGVTAEYARITQHLSRVELFNALDSRTLESLAYIAKEQKCQSGDRIVSEGESADGFYCVISGQLRVEKADPEREGATVFLADIGANDVFGEAAIFEQERRTATIVAASPATLLRFERKDFLGFLKERPLGSQAILMFIIERLLQKLSSTGRDLASARRDVRIPTAMGSETGSA